jgi:hypothetical protein
MIAPMDFTPTYQKVHDLIVVRDPSAAVCAVSAGFDPLVIEVEPTRIDLLHRPFRVWVGDREHRANAIVIGDGESTPLYLDYLAHDRSGRLITDATRTSVEGVFTRGCEAARDAMSWLAPLAEPVAA